MDLKDIEEWGRDLLQSEATKRGVRNPEVYSRSELMRLILQDYGAPTNVKEAARLIGGILGSAKEVFRSRLGAAKRLSGKGTRTYVGAGRDAEQARREAEAKPYADWAREKRSEEAALREAEVKPHADSAHDENSGEEEAALREAEAKPWAARSEEDEGALRESERVRAESRDQRRESERVRADARAAGAAHDDDSRNLLKAGWHEVPIERAKLPQEWQQGEILSPWTPEPLSEDAVKANLVPRVDERPSSQSGVRRASADALLSGEVPERESSVEVVSAQSTPPAAAEHISYGPHPVDGLLVRWSVTAEAIERARKVLGADGELAVRIVAVRADPPAAVKTDVIEHGPVGEVGDWTAPLLASEARYVSAIGLRSQTRFVSIVHASS